ncbi:MAG: sulfatase [Acidobacteriota bacterium]
MPLTPASTQQPTGHPRVWLQRLVVSALGALVLCAALALSSACQRPEPGRHVIVLLLDAARSDRFSSYGYERLTTPRMDQLASDGAVFEVHYTQATHTRRALPSLLFSRYFARPIFPNSDRVPFAAPQDLFRGNDRAMVSLPAVFSSAGYRTALISAHAWIKPNTSIAAEYDELYDLTVRPDIDPQLRYPRAEQAIDEAIAWIDEHWEEDFFLFIHLMDTHFPHAPGPETLEFLSPSLRERVADGWRPPELLSSGRPANIDVPLSGEGREVLEALYDGSLRYTDDQIGRLLDHLGDQLPETLIAITSDHGESLVEVPGRFGHGGPWYETVARIPWILYGPGHQIPQGARTQAFSESVDILPTLAAAADLELPAGTRSDGENLLPLLLGGAHPPTEEQQALQKSAVRSGSWKALFESDAELLLGSEAPHPEEVEGELYDLSQDPLEENDLWSAEPARRDELIALYREEMQRPWARFVGAKAEGPPTTPFALSIHHWGEFRKLQRGTFSLSADGPPWVGLEHGSQRVLFGRAGAKAIEVELPLPDGVYAVSATMQGQGSARWDGQPDGVPLDGGPWVGRRQAQRVEIGEMTVRNQRFQIQLTPSPDAPLLVRFFGFRPLAGPDTDAEAQRALEEQLESLGYIQ